MEEIRSILNFNDLLKDFPEDIWDIGWLSKDDLVNLANSPVKVDYNPVFHVEDNHIGIVFIKKTPRYDYGLNYETEDWFRARNIFANHRNVNEKKAAVLAGKGQQAKNTVFYSYKFGFDVHLRVYILHYTKVINLPERKKPNFNFLPQCEGCHDCENACPVHALHNSELNNIWVDFEACANFSHYGNDTRIPSIKWGWFKYFHPEVNDDEIRNITCPEQMQEKYGISDFESIFHVPPDGHLQFINYPVCRECVSQNKCSKYGGNHPYSWTIEIY